MIEALKYDDLVEKCGGKFKLVALIQRRWLQLMQGARPMIQSKGMTEMEIIVKEIMEGKIEMEIPVGEPDDEAEG
jgi:DNA-directed RNA polymerase subunit omega